MLRSRRSSAVVAGMKKHPCRTDTSRTLKTKSKSIIVPTKVCFPAQRD